MFAKVLIANRGEIAVRVIRACAELGIRSVAIYSEADRDALHVRLADEAWNCGPASARESYLDVDRVVAIAKQCGADALHPGYGFLAENPLLVECCEAAGVHSIGPSAVAMRAMGDKVTSRRMALDSGVPIIPGAIEAQTDAEAVRMAHEIGFPVMVKASAGGGGRGLRLVETGSDLDAAIARARSEAGASFGDEAIFIEKFIERPRHIEIQFLTDRFGNSAQLFERECSIQRRHQKVIEEAPANRMSPELRESMGEAALAMAAAVSYEGAGTCEFLLDPEGRFYFLEMNTRIQVEHAITEEITGIDIVREMIRIAAGEPLSFSQSEVAIRGHAIEARIFAEDPDKDFMPSPGTISVYRPPGGPGIRVDSGVATGSKVTVHYDPLVAKLIAWGPDRDTAIARLAQAASEFRLHGIRTSLPFHQRVLADPIFRSGDYDTGFIAKLLSEPLQADASMRRLACLFVATSVHECSSAPDGPASYTIRSKQQPDVVVEFEPTLDGGRRVVCDGAPVPADIHLAADGCGSLIVDGRQFEVTLAEKQSGVFDVAIAGAVLRLKVAATM